MNYTAKTFKLPELKGISNRTIEEHLKLYAGYVKHTNLIHEKIEEMKQDSDLSAPSEARQAEKNAYALAEIQRRLGFEFGGMKNHEYYFSQFEGGAKELPAGELKSMLEKAWGTVDNFLAQFQATAMTRGVGWAMLYVDRSTNQLVSTWVDEQHLGQLADLDIVLALDMWEHSYMLDYPPSEKKKYVDAFFQNLNWEVVAKRV